MLSIPEIATELVEQSISEPNEDLFRTIFLVGSKSVGKSTLLHGFLDKTEPARETMVLEYSFARKSTQKQSLEKTICHIWEYGGKFDILKHVLLSIPRKGNSFFCVVIDLSKIKSIWYTLETCILAITEACENSAIELIIMGGKYDIFKNYDDEIKKVINTTIRSVAVIYGAHVLYYSCKDLQLFRKAKEMFHNICFGHGVPFKDRNINFLKPLAIPKNSDNWESIGVAESNIEEVKLRHVSRIQPESNLQDPPGTELRRTHPEPVLDSLMTLKLQELRNLDFYEPSIAEYLNYI